jgi:hypothetical protein
MRVRFKIPHESHTAGSEADVGDDKGRQLITAGVADEVKAPRAAAPAAAGEEEPTMLLRFRHGATIGNKTYAGGTIERVPQSEEAWDAVNQGHADLDPPPGVAGQPFPPEKLQRSEATEVHLTTAQPQLPVRTPGAAGPPTPETIGRDPHTPAQKTTKAK